MRVMCLDIGTVRIGIAQSDEMQIIASPLEVYKRKNNLTVDAKYIANLANNNNVGTIVLGLPKKMDGSEGQSVDMVNAFAEKLKSFTKAEIVFQDERLSTVSAERILLEGNVRRDKRKDVIDKVAATIILQNYLDKISKNK